MSSKLVVTAAYDLTIKDWLDFELYLYNEVKAGRLVELQVDMYVQIMQAKIDNFLIRSSLISKATEGKYSRQRYSSIKFDSVVIPFQDGIFKDFLSIRLGSCYLGTINHLLNYHDEVLKLNQFNIAELLEFYVVKQLEGFNLSDIKDRVTRIHDWIYNKRAAIQKGEALIEHHNKVFTLSSAQIEATIELLAAYVKDMAQLNALQKIINNEDVEGYVDFYANSNTVIFLFKELALHKCTKLTAPLKEKLIGKIINHTRFFKSDTYLTHNRKTVNDVLTNESKCPTGKNRIKLHDIFSIE